MANVIILPRGTEFDGIACPPLRALTPAEANARHQARLRMQLTRPRDYSWPQIHCATEARLWDMVSVRLP